MLTSSSAQRLYIRLYDDFYSVRQTGIDALTQYPSYALLSSPIKYSFDDTNPIFLTLQFAQLHKQELL